jgi:TolB-like protein
VAGTSGVILRGFEGLIGWHRSGNAIVGPSETTDVRRIHGRNNMPNPDALVEPAKAIGEVCVPVGAAPDAPSTPASRDPVEPARKKNKRKEAKLRAAWISFTGRIVAQFVGSAASILLGIALLHKYQAPVAVAAANTPASLHQAAAYAGRVARTAEKGGAALASIVVLPIDDYSVPAERDQFTKAFTEVVTASLAESARLTVLSRTSASQLGATRRSVPAIARELGVDLVLEASVTRSADRLRVVAQLIDGRSDEHLWARRYDREKGDVLAVQGEISAAIARDIGAVLDTRAALTLTVTRHAAGGAGSRGIAEAAEVARTDARVRLQLP